jgi:hypothetical protein
MNYGLKTSKPLQNVLSVADDQLIFSSKLSTHPIYSMSSHTFAATSLTITHGLGYVPKVWINHVNADGTGFDRRLPYADPSSNQFDYEINSTQIIIKRDTSNSQTFKVIIFARGIL